MKNGLFVDTGSDVYVDYLLNFKRFIKFSQLIKSSIALIDLSQQDF